MRGHVFLGALCVVLCAGATASGHEYGIGDLKVGHPYAIETPAGARTGAGYLSVTNEGEAPDYLIDVRSDYPRTMLHRTTMRDGVARMEHVSALEIPPGGTVTLEPGGMHVMFMGIEGDPFDLDDKVPATLVFESAGEIEVLFAVQKRGTPDAMTDHGDHADETGR